MAAVTHPIDIIAKALDASDFALNSTRDAQRMAAALCDERIITHALAEVRSRPATRWIIEDLDDQELCTVLRVAFGSIANPNQETPTP